MRRSKWPASAIHPRSAAYILRTIKQAAETALGEPIQRAVITGARLFNEVQPRRWKPVQLRPAGRTRRRRASRRCPGLWLWG